MKEYVVVYVDGCKMSDSKVGFWRSELDNVLDFFKDYVDDNYDGMKDYVEVVKGVLYYDDGEMGYIVKERKLSEGRIC